MKDLDLLTIGDCSIDLYMKVAGAGVTEEEGMGQLPKICFFHGSKIPVDHFETSIAGNALNVAVGVKQMGLTPTMYTELGDDENGNKIINGLKELDIDPSFCVKNPGKPTNVHAVIVYGGDRTIFSYHDKRDYKILGWPKPKWIYYTSMGYGYQEFQKELIKYLQQNRGIGVAFNPGTIQMKGGVDTFKDMLNVTDILIVNKEEAISIAGTANDLQELHKKVNALGPRLSVITDGERGASAWDGKNFITHPIYSDKRPVLDRTGAGDAFSSGFMSAIILGKQLKEAVSWGIINSGNSIKEIGAIKGLLSKNEIENIYKGLLVKETK